MAEPGAGDSPLGPRLPEPLFGRLAVVGLGLVGSSIARAVRMRGIAGGIVCVDRDPAVVARVGELGLADEATTDLAAGVDGADLVVLCIPVGAFAAVAREIGPRLKPGAILSDTGSVKGSVVAQVQPHLPDGIHLVPAHPVAGTEYSGPDAGFATLFQRRWCILTPPEGTDPAATARVAAFWSAMGADVEVMTPEHHDLVLAITSHVPHLIAYNIVGTAADLETVTQSEVIKFSAGGFRDFTRIAASDPTMWRDIFLHNKGAVLEMLGRLNEDIAILARAIRWGDGEALFDLFTRTRDIRRGIISQGQETPEPDFGRRNAAQADPAHLPSPLPSPLRGVPSRSEAEGRGGGQAGGTSVSLSPRPPPPTPPHQGEGSAVAADRDAD